MILRTDDWPTLAQWNHAYELAGIPCEIVPGEVLLSESVNRLYGALGVPDRAVCHELLTPHLIRLNELLSAQAQP